jgi:hypothetical protein
MWLTFEKWVKWLFVTKVLREPISLPKLAITFSQQLWWRGYEKGKHTKKSRDGTYAEL